MRIGINTLFENPLIGTGGLSYIRGLVHALPKIDRENEYVLFVSPLNRHLFQTNAANFSSVLCPFSKEKRLATVVYEHTRLPSLVRKHGIHVFHSPGNIAPVWLPTASVVTLCTVHHYVVPKMIARTSLLYRRAFMPQTVRRADMIISISNFVRDSLKQLFDIPEDRVTTVYIGIGKSVAHGRPDLMSKLPEKYILFVSALWPYKNATRLVEAFALLKREGIEHKLVIVGSGWDSCRREVEQMAREKGVAEDVLLTGRVPDVWPYYEHADVFVYPSLHEEFGIPMLEAMLAGTPVVASDKGSLPEIAGDAALICEVGEASGLAAAIKRVLRDDALRHDLIRRGYRRVENFTWEETAKRTVQVYREAYSRWKCRTRGNREQV